MDNVLTFSQDARDGKKNQKMITKKSRRGKIMRRKVFLTKFAESHKEQIEEVKTG